MNFLYLHSTSMILNSTNKIKNCLNRKDSGNFYKAKPSNFLVRQTSILQQDIQDLYR